MTGDVLSDVLGAVRLRGAVFYRVEAAGPWAALAPAAADVAAAVMPGADHVMEFHVVTHGTCWAGLLDQAPECLGPGDIVLFPRGDAHVVSSLPELPARTPDVRFGPGAALPMTVRLGSGAPVETRLVCGFLGCDARPFNPLIAALPRMLRVPPKPGGDPVDEFVRIAAVESALPRPGSQALRARLAEMLFIAAVRRHLAHLPSGASGWLGGLRDPQVGRALAALHARPAQAWTLEALARAAGLSRTALHARFVALIGDPPMQYLARWRMQLAASRLTQGTEKIASVALEVGYESEAAFNRAFKREAGMPPAAWRRARRAGEPGLGKTMIP
jgi:AraC-like DNA-binding protein